ncbi:MAG: outer membrane lipoprotein carrier protein LolA [Candidatus Accumulibacter sp.]|nr:outer membrane lipoprotein carrier protein LolA [Accumulibacter sp.]
MRRLLVGLWALWSLSLPVLAAWDVSQLMDTLARTRSGRARFVETRYLAVLDKPLVASGEMSFVAPDRLEKRTLSPRPETLRLDKDRLTIERGDRQSTIDLAGQPLAQAFVASARAALTGDRTTLEKHYGLHLAGDREQWTLTLLPSDQAIANLVQRIIIKGQRNRVLSIDYLQADGDRSLLAIQPLPDK